MTRAPRNGNERGFALLTVIVIVMALTILGLSLFSLSGFEARFFRPTMDYAQAMQSTRGGIEWARYVLESTDSFDKVRTSTKPPGVSGVVARKGSDFLSAESTGVVFEDPPKMVWVRAVGDQGDQEGAVLAQFMPSAGQDLYKRLITVVDRLVINSESDRVGNTLLYGNIRMGAPKIVDYNGAEVKDTDFSGVHCVDRQSFPSPALDLMGEWWAQKYAVAQYLPATGGPFTIGPAGPEPAIYRTDPGENYGSPSSRYWSVQIEGAECTVNVRGISIWMFPDGLRCDTQLRFHNISSDPVNNPATVILVARPGPPSGGIEDDVAFALLGGIWVEQNVNLFIVSKGGVEIEHVNDAQTENGFASYLSVYADWAKFMGPLNPGGGGGGNADMELYHGSSCNANVPNDNKDKLVDQLIEKDLLPNSRLARRRLAFIKGSWQEKPATVGN